MTNPTPAAAIRSMAEEYNNGFLRMDFVSDLGSDTIAMLREGLGSNP
jgi:hypothetical protein